MSTTHVAAVVLTKNEAGNLERCFASLRWCAEIVVVDSGSTDGTQAKARDLGARVLEHVQPPPFKIDQQRNWALEHGGIIAPWVLFLDADETVPAALADELTRIGAAPASHDGYELTPRYLFWGTWLRRTQGFPNWHPRLVRLGHARFAGGVWEHFETGTNVGRIAEPYDHFANSKGLSDWLARHDRYSSWDAEKVVAFLESGRGDALGTARKARLRRWAARFWPLRPWARFCQMYFLRLGFLEGRAALAFCLLYFFYEWMTVVKIVELRRHRKGLPL
ncbi:MAG: glycosyltransferase family 2 protein [Opitutaceae bacterium]